MLKNKGFTLVEVLIAIALIMIISVTFVLSMTTHFSWLSSAKAMTQSVFAAQQSMETEIEGIKQALLDGVTPDDKVSLTLFNGKPQQITVEGYYREIEIANNRVVRAIVADSRMAEYPVPIVNKATLKLRKDNADLARNYDYVIRPGLSARATSEVADPHNVFLLNRHEWFVSRPGFNVPMVADDYIDEDFDHGRLYPIFPHDYDPVPIKANSDMLSQSDLTALPSEYTGRHIIYTITPYAMSGKKGTTVFSDPVYLHGPTVTNGLVLHLDASAISKDPAVSSIVNSGDNIFVSEWHDLSGSNNHAVQSVESQKPELTEVQYQDDLYVWGKSLQENNAGTKMRVSSFSPTTLNQFTAIIVAKSSAIQPNTNIIKGGNNTWSFEWNEVGNLAFAAGGIPAELVGHQALDDEWHIFSAVVSDNNISLRVDGELEGYGTAANSVSSRPLEINWANIDIAEILVYNRDLASGLDLLSVETYLKNKYNPDPDEVHSTIAYLKPMAPKTIIQGESFTPPSTVDAVMTNGTTQKVVVTWSGTIDTSTIGTQSITATANMDETKTTFLVVNVVGIERLIPHTEDAITLRTREYINLPSRLDAVLTNGTTRAVDVTWSSSVPEATVSETILTGHTLGYYPDSLTASAVLDPSKTAIYSVEVTGIAVTGVSVTPTSLEMYIADTSSLTATVAPADATDQSITWSSSSTSVATVDNNGLVTAHVPGSTTITVETLDGGFTATCEVTVRYHPVTVVGYEARNIQTYRSGFLNLNYHTSADIYIILSDGTEHFHGNVSASRVLSYPTINTWVTGNATADSSGESVSYNLNITVSP
ncbi:MAG TPA: Ig-like domain-containing protein [Oscillospiraceae bacterium]|nr:Ig-like domain-containing protein [Oscillospiraceae bacterium]